MKDVIKCCQTRMTSSTETVGKPLANPLLPWRYVGKGRGVTEAEKEKRTDRVREGKEASILKRKKEKGIWIERN